MPFGDKPGEIPYWPEFKARARLPRSAVAEIRGSRLGHAETLGNVSGDIMHRRNSGLAHPGSPRFIRKSQHNVLTKLARRRCTLEELAALLFGAEATLAQIRKLVATVATLVARQLVARSEEGDFRLTTLGRKALGEQQEEPQGTEGIADDERPVRKADLPRASTVAARSAKRIARRRTSPVALRPNLVAKASKGAGRRRP
jgi:hypothetical protein